MPASHDDDDEMILVEMDLCKETIFVVAFLFWCCRWPRNRRTFPRNVHADAGFVNGCDMTVSEQLIMNRFERVSTAHDLSTKRLQGLLPFANSQDTPTGVWKWLLCEGEKNELGCIASERDCSMARMRDAPCLIDSWFLLHCQMDIFCLQMEVCPSNIPWILVLFSVSLLIWRLIWFCALGAVLFRSFGLLCLYANEAVFTTSELIFVVRFESCPTLPRLTTHNLDSPWNIMQKDRCTTILGTCVSQRETYKQWVIRRRKCDVSTIFTNVSSYRNG